MQTDQQIIKPRRSELPQTKPQQTQALAPAPHSRPWLFPVALLGLTGAALFTVGTIAVRTLPLLPRLAKRSESVSSRLAYYVQHKQWKADLHTLVSAAEYVAWPAGSPATSPIAYAPDSTLPNS